MILYRLRPVKCTRHYLMRTMIFTAFTLDWGKQYEMYISYRDETTPAL